MTTPRMTAPHMTAQDPANAGDVVVAVRALSYTYPGGARALEDITFTVRAGQRIGVLGPNGAGKSTLLLHLSGILPQTPQARPAAAATGPAAGPAVSIASLPLEAKNLPRIREQVGLVFQNPDDQLFCPTVFDDVAFGPRNMNLPAAEVTRRVHESLRQVGLLSEDAAAAPLLRHNPLKLSLGQKKRVALATVLSMRPAIIAFDEPTANLDPRGRTEIIRLLATLTCTQIIVTHDLDLVREICHDVLLMSHGRIRAQGPAPTLLADHAALRAADLIE